LLVQLFYNYAYLFKYFLLLHGFNIEKCYPKIRLNSDIWRL
jgi:hypothetical protein